MSLADISILTSVMLAEVSEEWDLLPYKNLARWRMDVVAQLPFYEELAKPSVEQLRGFMTHFKSQASR